MSKFGYIHLDDDGVYCQMHSVITIVKRETKVMTKIASTVWCFWGFFLDKI